MSNINYNILVRHFDNSSVSKPFCESSLKVLSCLSKLLLNKFKREPELVSLGYWLRSSNIRSMYECFNKDGKSICRVPAGKVFHIAPSNVPTQFAYPWAISFLLGNANIVRLSSKHLPLQDLLVDLIEDCIGKIGNNSTIHSNIFVKYTACDKINTQLSNIADVRLVWGSDSTINYFKSISTPTHTKDYMFYDKFSICVIRPPVESTEQKLENLATKFIGDAYTFNQNGCSSPRLLIWITKDNSNITFRNSFWCHCRNTLQNKNVNVSIADKLKKLTYQCELALKKSILCYSAKPDILNITHLNDLANFHLLDNPGSGFFYETYIESIHEIFPIISRKLQTISVYGISHDELYNFIKSNNLTGVDRITSVGDALKFNYIWDGVDMIDSLSRKVSINI